MMLSGISRLITNKRHKVGDIRMKLQLTFKIKRKQSMNQKLEEVGE